MGYGRHFDTVCFDAAPGSDEVFTALGDDFLNFGNQAVFRQAAEEMPFQVVFKVLQMFAHFTGDGIVHDLPDAVGEGIGLDALAVVEPVQQPFG